MTLRVLHAVPFHASAALRRPRDRRAARSSTTVALAIESCATSPLSTVPGPTSTYVVTPSDARRRDDVLPAHRRRTCADQRLDRRRARRASARRRRWRRPARAGRAPRSARSSGARRSSAGFISAQWNGALTGSGNHALRAERLRALAGARDRVRVRRRSRPGPAPFRFAGADDLARRAASRAGLRDRRRRRGRGSPPSRPRRPAPLPACSARGAARCAGHRRSETCRPRRCAEYSPRLCPATNAGAEPARLEQPLRGDAHGEDRRLRVLGQRQPILGPFEAQRGSATRRAPRRLRRTRRGRSGTRRRAPCPCRPSASPVPERRRQSLDGSLAARRRCRARQLLDEAARLTNRCRHRDGVAHRLGRRAAVADDAEAGDAEQRRAAVFGVVDAPAEIAGTPAATAA